MSKIQNFQEFEIIFANINARQGLMALTYFLGLDSNVDRIDFSQNPIGAQVSLNAADQVKFYITIEQHNIATQKALPNGTAINYKISLLASHEDSYSTVNLPAENAEIISNRLYDEAIKQPGLLSKAAKNPKSWQPIKRRLDQPMLTCLRSPNLDDVLRYCILAFAAVKMIKGAPRVCPRAMKAILFMLDKTRPTLNPNVSAKGQKSRAEAGPPPVLA